MNNQIKQFINEQTLKLYENTPQNWKVLRNKVFLKPKKIKSESGEEDLLSVSEYYGVKPKSHGKETDSNFLSRSESLEGYLRVSEGDLVNNIMLMWKKGLGVSNYGGIVSPSYSVFEFKFGIPNYFNYLFRTEEYISEFRRNSTGVIMSRLRLYDDNFLSLKSHFPPIDEQQLIVSYLGKKTQNLDELIKTINKKIELLKEQRISLINEVVTKGLNPNVEMKDSGIEWIGKIPSHWEFIRLKYLFSLEGGKDSKDIQNDDGEYPILGTGGEIDRGTEFLYDKPTLLLGRKGTIDKPYLMKNPFWVSDVMYYTIQKTDMTPDYLLLLFKTVPFNYYVYGSTQPSMSRLDYESIYFPVPPSKEQNEITKHLEIKTQEIDQSISSEQKRVNLLKEYKQSLISEVVTGKTRVTEDMI